MLRKSFDFLHSILQTETTFTDFALVPSLFLGHNEKVFKHKSSIWQKKSNNLPKTRNRSMIQRKLFLIILAMFY